MNQEYSRENLDFREDISIQSSKHDLNENYKLVKKSIIQPDWSRSLSKPNSVLLVPVKPTHAIQIPFSVIYLFKWRHTDILIRVYSHLSLPISQKKINFL